MKNIITILLILMSFTVAAQTKDSVSVSEFDSVFVPKLVGEAFYDFIEFAGDQFHTKEWTKSDILLTNGLMVYDKKLKYNGFHDEVVWLNTANFRKFKLDKQSINEFWIKNSKSDVTHFKRINTSSQSGPKLSDIFAEVGVEGNLSFYIQHKIVGTGEEERFLSGKYYLLLLIKEKPLYYFKLPSGEYLTLRRITRNSFTKQFSTYKKDIIKFVKDKSLDLKQKEDVVMLVDFLNAKDLK